MPQVKAGDRVKIADREAVNADLKSGLFYGYFANLVGRVERVYDDNTVCVDVEIDSLPEDVRLRHTEMQTAARDKWIAGLPQEQRNRLSEADRQFKMSYKVLVADADVSPLKGGSAKSGSAAKSKSGAGTKKDEQPAQSADKAPARKKTASENPETDESVRRLTQEELEAKELEYLQSLEGKNSDAGE